MTWHPSSSQAPWSTSTIITTNKQKHTQKSIKFRSTNFLQFSFFLRLFLVLSTSFLLFLAWLWVHRARAAAATVKWSKVNIFNQWVCQTCTCRENAKNNKFKILKSMKILFFLCYLALGNNDSGHKSQQIKILLPLIWFYHIFLIWYVFFYFIIHFFLALSSFRIQNYSVLMKNNRI